MAYDEYELLHVRRHAGVAEVIIDHPPVNLIDRPLFRELRHVVREVAADDQIIVVVLSSAVEGFFLAHFDVTMMKDFPVGEPPPTELNGWHRMCETLRTMPKASIALVEGRAGGGGSEIALACDMRFAALETAVFNQPETALGLAALGGGTQRLTRLAGRARALEALLGCNDFSAELAESYNWVNRALPRAQLRSFVDSLAKRIAGFPPDAIVRTKQAVLRAEGDVTSALLADVVDEASFRNTPNQINRIERFVTAGGQTVAGEARLGRLVGELDS
ncbi:MAG: enoyl-CoA hydratase/isomerase family protein [Solirubrobacterales bacterium]|nr:enoyl-CoA hydratase/isomerase family protein [Solirubrobacterales bacterium]